MGQGRMCRPCILSSSLSPWRPPESPLTSFKPPCFSATAAFRAAWAAPSCPALGSGSGRERGLGRLGPRQALAVESAQDSLSLPREATFRGFPRSPLWVGPITSSSSAAHFVR